LSFDPVELLNFSEYAKLVAGLFAVTDPIGNVPYFLAATAAYSGQTRQRIIALATAGYVAVCLTFVFAGGEILAFFGISIDAFKIAGGLVIAISGFEMLRGDMEETGGGAGPVANPVTFAMVPLTIPLLAGPGVLSTLVVFSSETHGPSHQLVVCVVVLIMAVVVFASMQMATLFGRLLGPTGMSVLHRVMGLIILAIAVEFVLEGIAGHYPGLLGPG